MPETTLFIFGNAGPVTATLLCVRPLGIKIGSSSDRHPRTTAEPTRKSHQVHIMYSGIELAKVAFMTLSWYTELSVMQCGLTWHVPSSKPPNFAQHDAVLSYFIGLLFHALFIYIASLCSSCRFHTHSRSRYPNIILA